MIDNSYITMKECISDIKLLFCAKEIDPGRRRDETLSTYLNKKIKNGIKNAKESFNKELKKNSYKDTDLTLIALHDLLGKLDLLEMYLEPIYPGKRKGEKIRLLVKSNAFKSGRLKHIYKHLPQKLEDRDDLIDFIKSQGHMTNVEVKQVCSALTRKDWKKWLDQALETKELRHTRGGWR